MACSVVVGVVIIVGIGIGIGIGYKSPKILKNQA
jgi:hypothetical protein